MIDCYYFGTTNGLRASVMLEECGFEWRPHWLDISKGEHKTPEYAKLNPTGRIPTIVDADGPGGRPLVLTQSVAILLYLAEKAGKLIPADPLERAAAYEWLAFQATDMSPSFGAAVFLGQTAPTTFPDAAKLFSARMRGFYEIYDRRLAQHRYLAGATYSIADISAYTVAAGLKRIGLEIGDLANVQRWMGEVGARPAVQRGMKPPV